MALAQRQRTAAWSNENDRDERALTRPPTKLQQRADLERLRRRLAEPCELAERDLLTLLAYAVGGDGDPLIGLLDDTRATLAMIGEHSSDLEPNLVASLERKLAVAIELYGRATADG